jgi:Mce-associated membrane protein
VSKHNQNNKTVEEETIVPADTETEQAEETVTDDATEKADEPTEAADEPTEAADEPLKSANAFKPRQPINWSRVLAFGLLPALALVLAMAAGFLKWQDNSVRNSDTARIEAVQAAKDTTVKMLSYKPDSVEKDLNDARSLLTGDFRDQYTSLINDVVIPGAKEKQISAVATIPEHGAASVSADPNHAVVLLFVNQTVVVGQDAPTDTASSVRVTLDKVGDSWLISKFDPV